MIDDFLFRLTLRLLKRKNKDFSVLVFFYIELYGKDRSCKKKFRKETFQTGVIVAGGGFLSYCNHQLIKFKEEKRFGL